MFQALFDAKHSAEVGAWSLVLSAVGLVITIAGLAFTIVQVIKTRNAAEEAKEAANEARARVRNYDLVSQLTLAATSLKAALVHCSMQSWKDAAGSILDAHTAIENVIELADPLTPAQQLTLESMGGGLAAVRERLRATSSKGVRTVPSEPTIGEIERFTVQLAKVRAQIEKRI